MVKALIGFTGFVGSNLQRQRHFDATFNSSNISDIDGRGFSKIVCAGVAAVKWWANKNPEEDWQKISGLIDHLSTVEADVFTLISTVDVYGAPLGVTEDDRPDERDLHAYGINRLRLEDFVAKRFPQHHIVRLPALFGSGLKKNAIYDLMNDNMVEVINPASSFQWYPVARLADDLDIIEASKVRLVNTVTPPISMATIRDRLFPETQIGAKASGEAHYDIGTVHAALFGQSGRYMMSSEEVLADLQHYVSGEMRDAARGQ